MKRRRGSQRWLDHKRYGPSTKPLFISCSDLLYHWHINGLGSCITDNGPSHCSYVSEPVCVCDKPYWLFTICSSHAVLCPPVLYCVLLPYFSKEEGRSGTAGWWKDELLTEQLVVDLGLNESCLCTRYTRFFRIFKLVAITRVGTKTKDLVYC